MATKKVTDKKSDVIDYDNTGVEREFAITPYTTFLYEKEFGGADMIADVFGRTKADADAGEYVIDMTKDNWNAELRALWAALMTPVAAARRPYPHFEEWLMGLSPTLDFNKVSNTVVGAMLDQFFPSISAALVE